MAGSHQCFASDRSLAPAVQVLKPAAVARRRLPSDSVALAASQVCQFYASQGLVMRRIGMLVCVLLPGSVALAAGCEDVEAACADVHRADDKLGEALASLGVAAQHPWLSGGTTTEEVAVGGAVDDLNEALAKHDGLRRKQKGKCNPCRGVEGARSRARLWGDKDFAD